MKCHSCGETRGESGSFCPGCGARVERRLGGGTKAAAGLLVMATVVAVVAAVRGGGIPTDGGREAPEQHPVPVAATDLSQMTPQQQVDRLFQRVMNAKEAGDTMELNFFQPMAVAAYGMFEELDADARYHLGLLHLAVSNYDSAEAEVVRIRQSSPTHLYADALEIALAELTGDRTRYDRALMDFAVHFQSEIDSSPAEYTDHRGILDGLYAHGLAVSSAVR
ncbi:MAG: hypothetical protein ACE5FJ_09005 [Gemmatimonadales bacterium]